MDNEHLGFEGKPRRNFFRQSRQLVISSHLVYGQLSRPGEHALQILVMAASVSTCDLIHPSTPNGLSGWEMVRERWVFSSQSSPNCRSGRVSAQLAERVFIG